MRSFKVKFSGRDNGGSFLVSIDEQAKQFDVIGTSGARAPFGVVIHAVETIIASEFANPNELVAHARTAPFKVHRQDNMSASKIVLQILHRTEIMGQNIWVPKIAAQLVCSCNLGTGFGWDERNNCTFLPDLAVLSSFLHEKCPKWMEHYDMHFFYYEVDTYNEVPADWTVPERKESDPSSTVNNDEDKLIID